MPLGSDPILGPTVAGIIGSDGKITDAHRAAFVKEVVNLLRTGNASGKGLPLANLLGVPMPPFPGPRIPSPVNPENLFWFDPDPFADLSASFLNDKTKAFQTVIVDQIYAPIMAAINFTGFWTPALFDPTIFIPDFDLPPFEELPTLFAKFPTLILPPTGELFVKLPKPFPPADLPALPGLPPPIPKIPTLQSLGIDLASYKTQSLPSFQLPDLTIGVITAVFKFVPQLPSILIPINFPTPPAIFQQIFGAIFDPVLSLLKSLNLLQISPKLLSAALIVIMKNVAAALAVDAVGLTLGSAGICKQLARALSL